MGKGILSDEELVEVPWTDPAYGLSMLVVLTPLFLDPSDGVFGRFDLAALCGCHTLMFLVVVVIQTPSLRSSLSLSLMLFKASGLHLLMHELLQLLYGWREGQDGIPAFRSGGRSVPNCTWLALLASWSARGNPEAVRLTWLQAEGRVPWAAVYQHVVLCLVMG